MSARGSLLTSPRSRPNFIAESKRYIPLFWLTFLTSEDIEVAEVYGQFELDRKRALQRGVDSVSFFSSLFPQVPTFQEAAGFLLQVIRSRRSKTIGLDIAELVSYDGDDSPPTLRTAVEAIERRDADFSLTVPARTMVNPFTREEFRTKEKRFRSLQEILLQICWMEPEDLTTGSEEHIRNLIIGYVWLPTGHSN